MDNETKEKGCQWYFAPQEGGREDGPNDAMMQNFKSKPYQSLVREAVQNSLDAVLDPEKPVKVIIGVDSLNSASYPNFFKLRKHILSCADYFNWNKEAVKHYQSMADALDGNTIFGDNFFYIKVSDYNTKGMWYDSLQSNSPFYAFARAGGVSSKEGQGSGGSFGFGKSAYFQLSNISSVLISTMTEKNQHVLKVFLGYAHIIMKVTKLLRWVTTTTTAANPLKTRMIFPMRFGEVKAAQTFIFSDSM